MINTQFKTRRFELSDKNSNKFWEISLDGCEITTCWGRIGSNGQTKIKSFPNEEKAVTDADKQIAKKIIKGYTETGSEITQQPKSAVVNDINSINDIDDGESIKISGSGSNIYTITNKSGVYTCTCPAWRNQSLPPQARTCKHIRRLRGEEAELTRLGVLPELSCSSENTNAPGILLANKWDGRDPTGWWISEKLDGVRAYWDGKRFLSRQGNEYYAPKWFTKGLPEIPLDGELFGGRKNFQHTVGVARRIDRSDHWSTLSFLIFDAPEYTCIFEERLTYLEHTIKDLPFAKVLTHKLCKNAEHLQEILANIEELGGEGLMLRQPKSYYIAGRSDSLLKVKSFHDAEAIVVGYQEGKGRHKGRLGALHVELPDGTHFKVGSGFSDADRENSPSIGAIITFRYQELTNGGVPRFPTFICERHDINWQSIS